MTRIGNFSMLKFNFGLQIFLETGPKLPSRCFLVRLYSGRPSHLEALKRLLYITYPYCEWLWYFGRQIMNYNDIPLCYTFKDKIKEIRKLTGIQCSYYGINFELPVYIVWIIVATYLFPLYNFYNTNFSTLLGQGVCLNVWYRIAY